jgi:AcrR family transcriptional regulator
MLDINKQKRSSAARRPGRPSSTAGGPSKEETLNQAFLRFSEKGFDAFSVRDLAAELGIRDSVIHHHFGTKQELWYAAVDHVLTPQVELLSKVLSQSSQDSDPISRLFDSARIALNKIAAHKSLLLLIFREMDSPSERFDYLKRYSEPFFGLVDNAIEECKALGLMADIPPICVHILMIGAARMLISPGALTERLADYGNDHAKMSLAIDGILNAIFRGILSPEGCQLLKQK